MAGVAEMADPAKVSDLADVADIVDDSESRGVIAESVAEELAAADIFDELEPDAAAEAEDDAVLEMVALEMAAPDPDFDDAIIEPATAEIAEPAARVEEAFAAEPTAPVTETIATAEIAVAVMERPVADVAQAAMRPTPSPVSEPSLGASILASGMLQKPRAASDPLAPIRRMSQAEKIALFS
jgi:hypothetical protein